MKYKPLVSVIMPAYNAERYIEIAIDSIINQTYQNWELCIIDDCSTDATMQVVNQYDDRRIRIFHNEKNQGIAFSRNKALDYCIGKYIAIMDDDDYSFPLRFEKQVDYLNEHSEIDILGGAVERIDAEGRVISKASQVLYNPMFIKTQFLFRNIFYNSEVMFRRDLVDKYHIRYSDGCYGMEDFKFWIECSKVGLMTNLDDKVIQYRSFDDSESARIKRELSEERKKFYAYLQGISIRGSGFDLTDEEIGIINKCYRPGQIDVENKDDFINLFHVMEKMLKQACNKKMDFCEELKIHFNKTLVKLVNEGKHIWE